MVLFVTQCIDPHPGRGRVEDPQHDFFPVHGRKGVHAEVDGTFFRKLHLDAAILRDAPLRNIHLRHYLQACCESRCQIARRLYYFSQNAICAKAHPIILFVGLKVNVRRSLLDGIQQHLTHEPHDRRVVRRVVSIVFFLDGSIADLQIILAIGSEGGHVAIKAA